MSGRPLAEVPQGKHICPGPECHAVVDRSKLACWGHWGQVSRPHKSAVYGTWRGGAGAGTMAHLRAMEDAIADMTPLRKGGRG